MANSAHLAKLYEGVDVWNAWRKQNPDIRPDLSGADLKEVDLSGADLRMANLSFANLSFANLREVNFNRAYFGWADLREADLDEANLTEANFVEANLVRANLVRANLVRADLRGVNLRGADLRGADLPAVNLGCADLVGADLTDVRLLGTIFANINLINVKGLESCVHEGPSIIDYRTLAHSGKLPLSFLRGCGLPDTFIDYLPSLLNQPIQHYSCFISYSTKDEALAKRLHADLQDKGIRCWFAPEDIKIGDKIRTRIDEAIRIHDKLLLVLSQDSVASAWVENEVETALDKEIERKELVLFPIRLDDAVMESKTGWAADIRRSRHIGNFSNWKNHDDYQRGLERLLRDLEIEKGE